MNKRGNRGWQREPVRHRLASQGIRTSIRDRWKDKKGDFFDQMAWEEMKERIDGDYKYIEDWAEELSEAHYSFYIEGDKSGYPVEQSDRQATNEAVAEAVDRLLQEEGIDVKTTPHSHKIYAEIGTEDFEKIKEYGSLGEDMEIIYYQGSSLSRDELIENGKRGLINIIVNLAAEICTDFRRR